MAQYELDPLELLRTELKENDYESIIKTINKITIIGLALGPDRTRKELLPFLKDYAEVDNDEAQAAVAAQLGDFVPLVGGSEHGSLLLPLLENLCGMEETAIRDAAVQSLNKIIPQLPPAETAQKVFPMIKRLASGDWFYSRMSAAGVCGVTYPVVPDEAQREILAIFNNLCNDDTPMVRKAAYQCLGPTAINMQKDRIKEEMIPLVQGLSQDDLDSMRIFTIEACAVIAQVFDDPETDQYIIPAVINMHDDPSWRIRQHYCKTIDKLTKNVGPDLSGSKLLPGFVKLLHDHESNVRISAAQVMHLVAANCSQVSLQQFLAPAFEDLVGDENDKVRVAFASACVHMCEVFGAEQSQKFLLPFIQTLAKDAQSDVRNAIISNIHLLAKTMGPQIVDQSILPILTDLSKDLKWRVRLEVTGKISFVARELASSTGIDACESKLMTMLVNGLTDHVYSIREKACDQVAELTEYLGITWSTVKLFPVALAVFEKSTNYLHRMTSLIIVKQVLKRKVISGSDAEKLFLPLVIAACRDPVANVRFAAAKTMRVLVPLIDKTAVDTQAVPVLSALTKDSDVDVKFFAEEALKLCV